MYKLKQFHKETDLTSTVKELEDIWKVFQFKAEKPVQ